MSFIEVAKGAAIGVANIIPGVSGGTVALMLGIYEKLTEAVGEFALATKEKKIENFNLNGKRYFIVKL